MTPSARPIAIVTYKSRTTGRKRRYLQLAGRRMTASRWAALACLLVFVATQIPFIYATASVVCDANLLGACSRD